MSRIEDWLKKYPFLDRYNSLDWIESNVMIDDEERKAEALEVAIQAAEKCYEKLGSLPTFEIRHLAELYDLGIQSKSVLDIGSGAVDSSDKMWGFWLPNMAVMMSEAGADVTGLDIRPTKYRQYRHIEADLSTHTLKDLFEGQSFDIIYAVNVFDILPQDLSHRKDNGIYLSHIHSLLDGHFLTEHIHLSSMLSEDFRKEARTLDLEGKNNLSLQYMSDNGFRQVKPLMQRKGMRYSPYGVGIFEKY